MPSPAFGKYQIAVSQARILRAIATDRRIKPIRESQLQIYCHSSLTAIVAAWDAYLHNLTRDFFSEISDPLVSSYNALYLITDTLAQGALQKFNTPNWEKSRNLLVQLTGYDPINDWIWPARQMNVQQVQDRLNQILQVRHSFAHGLSIPPYPWTQSLSGKIRLTIKSIRDTEMFFKNLVRRTDQGMKKHLYAGYGRGSSW